MTSDFRLFGLCAADGSDDVFHGFANPSERKNTRNGQ